MPALTFLNHTYANRANALPFGLNLREQVITAQIRHESPTSRRPFCPA